MTSDLNDPIAAGTWLLNRGRYEDALYYATLFWPPFVEVEGCVLLGTKEPETFREWQAKCAGDRARIEAMLNHRHLEELFLAAPDPTPEMTRQFGRVLREMWMAKLAQDFPGQRFVVSVSEGEDPEITFCSERRDG